MKEDLFFGMLKAQSGKKLTIVNLDEQEPPIPPEIIGWYNFKTKKIIYPDYPYGLGKEWEGEVNDIL